MKIIYLLADVCCIALHGCNPANSKADTKDKVYTVEELPDAAYDIVGDTLQVSGFCADMCQGGYWVVLQGQDTTKVIQAVARKNMATFNKDVKFNNLTIKGVLHEKRVDSLFLVDWTNRLDESLKNPSGGNPTAVAQLKEQIAQIYAEMEENREKHGRNYWSQFTIEVSEYAVKE